MHKNVLCACRLTQEPEAFPACARRLMQEPEPETCHAAVLGNCGAVVWCVALAPLPNLQHNGDETFLAGEAHWSE